MGWRWPLVAAVVNIVVNIVVHVTMGRLVGSASWEVCAATAFNLYSHVSWCVE
jgi:hypothetical protein